LGADTEAEAAEPSFLQQAFTSPLAAPALLHPAAAPSFFAAGFGWSHCSGRSHLCYFDGRCIIGSFGRSLGLRSDCKSRNQQSKSNDFFHDIYKFIQRYKTKCKITIWQ